MWFSHEEISFIMTLVFCVSWGQHPKCNYMQSIPVNTTARIYTPRYPRFVKNLSCRWLAEVPEGYNCKLYCKEFFPVLLQSQSCTDRLLVSRSGDVLFESADLFCGRGPITTVSFGRNISIGLISNFKTRLSCTITAVPAVDPKCRCGWTQSKIKSSDGGELDSYPFIASIVNRNSLSISCIGMIVDRKHVLTTAHCVIGTKVADLGILAGENAILDHIKTFPDFLVTKIKIHPMYSPSSYDFDAALLELSHELDFNEDVGPVCLPFKFVHDDLIGSSLVVLGWSNTSTGPASGDLVKMDVDVTDPGECRHSTTRITNRIICTFAPGNRTCQEHPGGPLIIIEEDTGLVFGVGTAQDGMCTSSPRPGTSMSRLLHWIQATTKYEYCRK